MNKSLFLFLSLLALLILFSCGNVTVSPAFTLETVNLKDLQDEDVYFIFTNPSPVDEAPVPPSVNYGHLENRSSGSRDEENPSPVRPVAYTESGGIIDAQLWKISEDLNPETGDPSRGSGVSFVYVPPSEDIGTSITFRGVSDIDNVPDNDMNIDATCREKVSYDGKTLVIYVADDCWSDGGTKANLVTEPMVTALRDEFLLSGGENDIRDWVTDIYGEPWGAHSFSNMIEPGAEDYITILLYDIAGDESTNGGIVGYFNSGNNYLKTSFPDSNERLMFAMDAVLFAEKDDTSWEDTDYWPQSVFSTLAHEFQHMVHYYQKQIVFGAGFSTWLNEMCSMVTEDLLADKIGVPGPRGVDPPEPLTDDGSAGDPGYCSSTRISTYNYWADDSLTLWGSSLEEKYISYASAYSFGAYIARNYGGAALLRKIVRSEWTDEQAVTRGISALDYGDKSFGELLTEWAVAALDSDSSDNSEQTFNTGGFRSSSPDNFEREGYNLGSIDLYNYDAVNGSDIRPNSGPVPYGDVDGTFNPGNLEATPPASNIIFLAGRNLSGDVSWDVELPRGMTLTVYQK